MQSFFPYSLDKKTKKAAEALVLRADHIIINNQLEVTNKETRDFSAQKNKNFEITKDTIMKLKNEVCAEFEVNTFPDSELLRALKKLHEEKKIKNYEQLERLFQKRRIRTLSGIAPISVLLPPGPCNSACVYCPTERANKEGKTLFQLDSEKKYGKQNVPKKYQKPGALVMPKSYISSEPGAMRALLAGFDPTKQIHRRLKALIKIGHKPEKNELIVQGGTFSDVPREERDEFIKKCYEAFNSFDFEKAMEDSGGEKSMSNKKVQNLEETKRNNKSVKMPYTGVLEKSKKDHHSCVAKGIGESEASDCKKNITSNFDPLLEKNSRQISRSLSEKSSSFSRWDNLKTLQKQNEQAQYRVIGLTLETRPSCIDEEEIREFRKLGCTRVELGVQTLDDDILKKIYRVQTREDVVRATQFLRNAGFKICYHMMPMLPFSTPEKDIETYKEIFENPNFRPDLVKIYPCSVTPFSLLQKWYEDGKYKPYSNEVLYDLLIEIKKITPPWCRISRLIRDIPKTAIIAGNTVTNLNQLIEEKMKQRGEICRDIRSREVRDQEFTENDIVFRTREYEASEGMEYFLSHELKDETLLSMLRLRFPKKDSELVFGCLKNTALIRELHSFGSALSIGSREDDAAQHIGLGRKLLEKAEEMAKNAGYSRIAVISGIGVKNYYRKFGFEEIDTYMVKKI